MVAPADHPSLWLAAVLADAIQNAIPEGASDDLCMDALRLVFVEFARSAIKDGTPRAALVLWAAMLLDDVEDISG